MRIARMFVPLSILALATFVTLACSRGCSRLSAGAES